MTTTMVKLTLGNSFKVSHISVPKGTWSLNSDLHLGKQTVDVSDTLYL